MDFEVESTEETAAENPFLDYRLNVTFARGDDEFLVPGYYAADGNAAETGASSGGVWRVKFCPPAAGTWEYAVRFRRGEGIAIDHDAYAGTPVEPHDGKTGSVEVAPPADEAEHFEKSGGLFYNDSRYLHTRDGEPLMLFGTNSPENFLAYEDIDGTYAMDPGRDYIKSWQPHVADWKPGDPTWMGGKGKGIIGALNYLHAKGMNVIYALSLNIDGDSRDVWPFLSHRREDYLRYDVSKLAQWEIVFRHAEKLGIAVEVITQEQENQLLLDDGFTRSERKLYYRELIARFSHLKNVIWNIGEENGFTDGWPHGQNDQQRFAMLRYFEDVDPHDRPILMHTYPEDPERDAIALPLLKFDKIDGLSMQIYEITDTNSTIAKWVERTKDRRPWVLMMDEIGPYDIGTRPDRQDPDHDRERMHVLWPSLLAGAAGVQWYFGWVASPHDLNAEDLRSRDNIWEQTAHARTFFEKLDCRPMMPANELVSPGQFCLAEPGETYVIYLPLGWTSELNLKEQEGEFRISWFDPRNGGALQQGSVETVSGGADRSIGKPPSETHRDWVVLVEKVEEP